MATVYLKQIRPLAIKDHFYREPVVNRVAGRYFRRAYFLNWVFERTDRIVLYKSLIFRETDTNVHSQSSYRPLHNTVSIGHRVTERQDLMTATVRRYTWGVFRHCPTLVAPVTPCEIFVTNWQFTRQAVTCPWKKYAKRAIFSWNIILRVSGPMTC